MGPLPCKVVLEPMPKIGDLRAHCDALLLAWVLEQSRQLLVAAHAPALTSCKYALKTFVEAAQPAASPREAAVLRHRGKGVGCLAGADCSSQSEIDPHSVDCRGL